MENETTNNVVEVIEETENTKCQLLIHIDKETKNKLKVICAKDERSMSFVIRKIIEEYVNKIQ